ncbi:DUF3079 domain-containing protein [Stenotrophomonas sp. SI-NJAU-1]|nr:DUF3079 domain-containing protein [Stenotrophomonas sp. SI-NJAU-1]
MCRVRDTARAARSPGMARRYRYCAADTLACGNGSGRTQHPIETQDEDWYVAWGIEPNPDRPTHAKR